MDGAPRTRHRTRPGTAGAGGVGAWGDNVSDLDPASPEPWWDETHFTYDRFRRCSARGSPNPEANIDPARSRRARSADRLSGLHGAGRSRLLPQAWARPDQTGEVVSASPRFPRC